MKVSLPQWAEWFDTPWAEDGNRVRHRVLFGGRGGGKSWTIAHKLVERAARGPERILCAREYQNSIRDSSKKLIEDVIDRMGLGPRGNGFFQVSGSTIRGKNGSSFSFLGLTGHDASIKSLEGFTLVWIEEAVTITQSSIDALIPTIRREGSELWWSFNPRHPTDPVDRMFRDGAPPPGSVVLEVHHEDNKWFPDVLMQDMGYDRSRDPEKYQHIWRGQYLVRSEARVFSNWQQLPFEAPAEATFRFGADWGYAVDPTVLIRCFIGRWEGEPGKSNVIADPKGPTLFVDREAYQIECSIDDTPALFAGSDQRDPPRWRNPAGYPGIPGAIRQRITADNARPETIQHMQVRGFNIQPAIKGPGSVEDGISFLKSFDIVVHPRCKHLIDELIYYSWVVDKQTGTILPKLADQFNHVIDALRYALEGARKVPGDRIRGTSAGPRVALTCEPPTARTADRSWGSILAHAQPPSYFRW